jgi:uncharacterized protein YwlG (UPF0340 family)
MLVVSYTVSVYSGLLAFRLVIPIATVGMEIKSVKDPVRKCFALLGSAYRNDNKKNRQ